MDNKKIIVGLVALALGFVPSFFFWRNYNQKNSVVASSGSAGSTGDATQGAGGQQAAMGQVQAIITKAKDNPNDFQAQVNAARVFDEVGRTKEAVDYLLQADKLNPTSSADLGIPTYIAKYYLDQKNYAGARAWYEKELKAKPDDSEATIELGATYLEAQPQDPDKAIQYLQGVLSKNPKDTHALFHLTQAYLLKKDTASAEDALNRIKTAEPNNQNISGLQGQIDAVKAGQPITIQ